MYGCSRNLPGSHNGYHLKYMPESVGRGAPSRSGPSPVNPDGCGLPPAKMTELQELIQSWVHHRSCIRRQLESLIGKPAHTSKVVQPGKTFMWRMFELLTGTCMAHHHIRLNTSPLRPLVGHFHGIMEWCHNGAVQLPGLSKHIPSCIDRCFRVFWLWSSVAHLSPQMAAATVAERTYSTLGETSG